MQIEKRKVSELKFYPGNPRKISPETLEKLKNSIKEFGIVDPLVINKNNEVIGGDQRLKAIRELGITEVDCVVVDLPKSKEKALNIALNKIQGEFDEELLKAFIEDIEPIDLELTGLDDSELYVLDWQRRFDENTKGKLRKDFLYPPFTVIDTRSMQWKQLSAYWQDKYGNELTETKDYLLSKGMLATINKGTSKFDPVLASVIYKWFMPKDGGIILNPTCGEPTTGVVAGDMGFGYLGVDIREEQVNINKALIEKYKLENVQYITYDATKLNEQVVGGRKFDLVFFSPPYYSLEVYSLEQSDISNKKGYLDFMNGFSKIIKNAAHLLKENRFYVIKLGDIREVLGPETGTLLNFIGDTVNIAKQYGLKYYNDIILVNAVGTGAVRARKYFHNRKMVRVHQRVVVFYKGDFNKIQEEFAQEFDEEAYNKFIGEKIVDDEDIES